MKNKNPLKMNLNRESKPFLIVKKVNDNEAISDIENIDSELELMSLTISAVATSIVVAKKKRDIQAMLKNLLKSSTIWLTILFLIL